jgi:hypothetical protein
MPRPESNLGTPAECDKFEIGTDPVTVGWWYHGTTESEARAFIAGTRRFKGTAQVCFTRNPKGASQDLAKGHWVLRVKVNLQRPLDSYFIEDASVGITQGFDWLKMHDASRIMIDSEYIQHEPDR